MTRKTELLVNARSIKRDKLRIERGRFCPQFLIVCFLFLTSMPSDGAPSYQIMNNSLPTSPSWSATGFGTRTSTAGDVNGDGYDDIMLGAPYYYFPATQTEGLVVVYHGSATGLGDSPDWKIVNEQKWDMFGGAISTAGDVNGDGYDDVIIGAHEYNVGDPEVQSDEGAAYVYYGSASGLVDSPSWMVLGSKTRGFFGLSVSTAGDVNGDGYDDVIVGEPMRSNAGNIGEAYIYYGSPSGLSASPSWTAEGHHTDEMFGYSVSTAGDVNGDGFDDIIIGAPYYDMGLLQDQGAVFVYLGSPSGPGASPDWISEGDRDSAKIGHDVSTAGDVNGDGYADVIVGAYRYENDNILEGAAFVYHGSAVGLGASPVWTAYGNQDLARFGRSISTAGDVNLDGYADIIVGAHGYDNDQKDAGRASVYYGSISGLRASPDWVTEGDQRTARLGSSVSTAGDVNGDGAADIIVGVSGHGKVEVYHGSIPGPELASNENPVILPIIIVGDVEETSKTFEILSVGGKTLEVTTATITGEGFSLPQPGAGGFPFSLEPEASREFKIRFDYMSLSNPSAVGIFSGTLSISSNDPDSPITTISLQVEIRIPSTAAWNLY